MNHDLTPETVGPPSANYALATLTDSAGPMLHTSGIGPVRPDGTVPDANAADGMAEQASVVWSTLRTLLESAQMDVTDVVSVHTYVVEGHDLGAVMAARDRALQGHRCASVLVPVPSLASPEWKMEIAVVACAT